MSLFEFVELTLPLQFPLNTYTAYSLRFYVINVIATLDAAWF